MARSLGRNHISADTNTTRHLIPGFHAVRESLAQGRVRIAELWIAEGKKSSRTREILQLAQEKRIPVLYKKRLLLDNLVPHTAHQGIIARADRFSYVDLEDLVILSRNTPDPPLLIATDHITDEGNLGALMRTAAFFGSHGLILPRDRSAGVSEKVRKRSSGAYVHLPVARIVNLARSLKLLSQKGFWIIGATGESPENIYEFDWSRPVVLIFGREDRGLSPSIRKQCHQLVGIPGAGSIESLNVSVACGVILSEIVRRRKTGNESAPLFG